MPQPLPLYLLPLYRDIVREDYRMSLSDLSALLEALTSPIPTALSVPSLLSEEHLILEHDLSRNPDQESRWLSYINTIKEEVLSAQLASRGTATELEIALLGPKLATSAGRKGLQRLVDIHERALSQFPTSFNLWKNYLIIRSSYVLGQSTLPLNLSAPQKKRGADGGLAKTMLEYINAGKEDYPQLTDSERDLDQSWEGALDGIVGYAEWTSLAAVHERALMWLPRVCIHHPIVMTMH